MEFLDPNYRKRHDRLLLVGYVFLAVLIAGIATLVTLQASGYSITQSGEIQENSLLFIDSSPAGARVLLNGVDSGSTNSRIVTNSGSYTVELSKDGYLPWSKELLLDGRSVEFLKYPFLFPVNPTRSTLTEYLTATTSTQSPSQKYVLIKQPSGVIFYDLVDLTDPNPWQNKATVNMSYLLVDGQFPLSVEFIEWSTNDRALLLKANFEGASNYWLVDLFDESRSIQLPDSETDKNMEIRLVDGKADKVDILSDSGLLRRYDVQEASFQPLAAGVINFKTHGLDRVLYARYTIAKDGIEVIAQEDLNEYVVAELPFGNRGDLSLDLTQFESNWYYAIGSRQSDRLRIYLNPIEELRAEPQNPLIPISNLKVNLLSGVKFSKNARFLAASNDQGLVVYDAEKKAPYRYQIQDLPADYAINWMDGHRMTANINGQLTIWEFDGVNKAYLGSAIQQSGIYFAPDYKNAYYLTQIPESPAVGLVQESLIVP